MVVKAFLLFIAFINICLSADPYGLTTRHDFINTKFPLDPGGSAFEPAFKNLWDDPLTVQSSVFVSPIQVLATPAGVKDDRLFVVQLNGEIKVFPNKENVTRNEVKTFLNLKDHSPSSTEFMCCGEVGLLGMAFDPDYHTNGLFYLHYSGQLNNAHHSVIVRYQVSNDPDKADSSTHFKILTIEQPQSNHNGGMLAFGPDKNLYIGFGDGGGGSDFYHNAQNPNTLLGAIIRIKPATSVNPQYPYTVPQDNPNYIKDAPTNLVRTLRQNRHNMPHYADVCMNDNSTAKIDCPELFAMGIRNPWRFSMHPNSNKIWVGDVGQSSLEEITLVDNVKNGITGKYELSNHGWPCVEGNIAKSSTWLANHSWGHELQPICESSSFSPVAPIHVYRRNVGRVVVGGFYYGGQKIQEFHRKYIFGDYGSGSLFASIVQNDTFLRRDQIGSIPSLTSFGVDQDNEVYAVKMGGYPSAQLAQGKIYRLVKPTPGKIIPAKLKDTGLFSNPLVYNPSGLAYLNPVDGCIPYDVAAPLWSDEAEKFRWICLPKNGNSETKISFSKDYAWQFPVGTILIKHFQLRNLIGAQNLPRFVETRIMIKGNNGWNGYTYEWDQNNSEANLIQNGRGGNKIVVLGNRIQQWFFPDSNDCLQCHKEANGFVLGPKLEQLNSPFTYPSSKITDNQLRTWSHIGMFSSDPSPRSNAVAKEFRDAYAWMADYRGETNLGTKSKKARSYLDVNCAHCHQPGGGTPIKDMDLRFQVSRQDMHIVDVDPLAGDMGLVNPKRISSGNLNRSVLYHRSITRGFGKMPPIASNLEDPHAKIILGDWIKGKLDPASREKLEVNCQSQMELETTQPALGKTMRISGSVPTTYSIGGIYLSWNTNYMSHLSNTCSLYIDFSQAMIVKIVRPINGQFKIDVAIPNNVVTLLNSKATLQALFFDSAGTFSVTNGMRVTIGHSSK